MITLYWLQIASYAIDSVPAKRNIPHGSPKYFKYLFCFADVVLSLTLLIYTCFLSSENYAKFLVYQLHGNILMVKFYYTIPRRNATLKSKKLEVRLW